MRAVLVGALCIVLVVAGTMSIGQAQTLAVTGTIQAVDCQTASIAIASTDGRHILSATASTGAFVNGAAIGFCALRQYVGYAVTVGVAALNSRLVVTRIDVGGAAAPVPPPPPAYEPMPPLVGIVLGTIVAGGLLYLLVRDHYRMLRHPYYGPYYRHYYHPSYRPYVGPYRAAPGYWYGPYRQCSPGVWGRWCWEPR